MPKRKLSAIEQLQKNAESLKKLAVKARFTNPNNFVVALMAGHLNSSYDIMAVDGMRETPVSVANLDAFLTRVNIPLDVENRRRLSVFIAICPCALDFPPRVPLQRAGMSGRPRTPRCRGVW